MQHCWPTTKKRRSKFCSNDKSNFAAICPGWPKKTSSKWLPPRYNQLPHQWWAREKPKKQDSPVPMVLKTDVIILLTYLGLQSNQISKCLKSCICQFYWSYCLVVTQANHCSEFHMPKCPKPNSRWPIIAKATFLDLLLTNVRFSLYLLTKFPQGRLSDLLTSLHFPRSLDIPIIMSFLALSRVRARSCEFFCKNTNKQTNKQTHWQN